MDSVEFLLEAFEKRRDDDAIVWRDRGFSYGWLLERVQYWRERFATDGIAAGSVVAVEGDFSPNAVALFLALAEHACVLVPIATGVAVQSAGLMDIAQTEVSIRIDDRDAVSITRLQRVAEHELYRRLRTANHPGLVLFSSGSTGVSKAAVHDLTPLLEKFKLPRQRLRTITFLLYDHIGGVNTLLYTLSNGGCVVSVQDRRPDAVLAAVARHHVELLPTSPTFINLVLLSEAYKRHDLSSLKTITYGTEPMPSTTLKRFNELFPGIRLQQTYGLSEVGILRSRSRSSDSLWVKVGGEGYLTRVVNDTLQIKAQSAMLGYLNAPSPFTADGWLDTGDAVEVDGEYIKILGRTSEIINVGGEKVYPAEVESVIQERSDVADVAVFGERNPIMGQIVCARVTPVGDLDDAQTAAFVAGLKRYCRARLRPFQVPIKVLVVHDPQHSPRFKRVRK